MNRFAILEASDYAGASALLRDRTYRLPILKAGGMDLVDHLKEGLIEPDALVNVLRAEGGTKAPIQEHRDGGASRIRLSALHTLREIGSSALLRERCPALAQAAESAATPQVRNVATCAGNLLQRPRCWYYRAKEFDCLKKGGDRCFAVRGLNRYHAIFGGGPCHIVHPSNIAVPLMVLGARVEIVGGERGSLAIADLFHLPEQGVRSEHTLRAGEVISAITLAASPRSGFYAIKEKQSFDWPVVMAAAALELEGDRIVSARVCAGAVAPVPWMLPHVGEALSGVSLNDDAALRRACDRAGEGATPMSDNAFKVRLLGVAVRRAVLRAGGKETA